MDKQRICEDVFLTKGISMKSKNAAASDVITALSHQDSCADVF